MTSERKQFLYSLRDYSGSHHTGQFLASEIKTVLNDIGVNKFVAIVSDNGSNVKLAWEMITAEYPYIINVQCIAHYLNLITKSIMGKC